MATKIEIENELRVRVTFTDEDGIAVDPTTVKLEVKPPEGTSPASTTYEYLVDPQIERADVGVYTALIFVDVAGHWTYTWQGDGPVRGSKTGCFDAYEGCEEDAA